MDLYDIIKFAVFAFIAVRFFLVIRENYIQFDEEKITKREALQLIEDDFAINRQKEEYKKLSDDELKTLMAKNYYKNNSFKRAFVLCNMLLDSEFRGEAYAYLGLIYEKIDRRKTALKYFKKGTEYNNSIAIAGLALITVEEENNYKKCLDLYLKGTKLEYSEAMLLLKSSDDYYAFIPKAIEWAKRTVETCNNKAFFLLGHYYQQEGDTSKAIEYYLKGIEIGDVEAMYNLGFLYSKQGDQENAIKFYRMAATRNFGLASKQIGSIYIEKNDFNKAIKWFKKALKNAVNDEQKSEFAYNLAVAYGSANKQNKAIEYYELAVEKNYVQAMYNLGYIYEEQKDYNNAIKYYKMAAERNYSGAMYNLGNIYQCKLNNVDKAIKWYQKAIHAGHQLALVNLGIAYEDNNNLKLAMKLWHHAAESGIKEAMMNLHEVYKTQKNLSEAQKWLDKTQKLKKNVELGENYG